MKANRVSARPGPACAPWLLTTLLVAGCAAPQAPVTPPPPPRQVSPATAPAVAPAAAPADWRDAAQTPGTWRWAMVGGHSTASYGLPGGPALVRLSCDAPGGNTILWTNRTSASSVPLAVTTTATRRLLTARPDGAAGSSVTIPARDALLDAMAFSRGRFMLEVAGFPALYLPAWPELSRVIEDCRPG